MSGKIICFPITLLKNKATIFAKLITLVVSQSVNCLRDKRLIDLTTNFYSVIVFPSNYLLNIFADEDALK